MKFNKFNKKETKRFEHKAIFNTKINKIVPLKRVCQYTKHKVGHRGDAMFARHDVTRMVVT